MSALCSIGPTLVIRWTVSSGAAAEGFFYVFAFFFGSTVYLKKT
jgi:hypothetical protein